MIPYVPPAEKETSKDKIESIPVKQAKKPLQILAMEPNFIIENDPEMKLNLTDEELINIIQQTENDYQELMLS